jgi:hypothetical protein
MSTTQSTTTKERGGRPPGSEAIRSTAARKAAVAVETLAEIATDRSAPASDRVQAARALLEAARPNAVHPSC